MKVTFLAPVLSMSGGIRVIAIYADYLAQQGHSVSVVSHLPPKVPWYRMLKRRLAGKFDDRVYGGANPYFQSGSRINHVLVPFGERPNERVIPDSDVIVATWWETAKWASSLPAAKGRLAYLIQHHEVFPYLPVDEVKATYRNSRLHKIVIAPWLLRVLEKEYGQKSILIENGVDHGQFYSAPREMAKTPTIGFLFSRVPFKGLDVTLAALKLVKLRLPAAKFISFGIHEPTSQEQAELGIQFHLNPKQEFLRLLYSQCDVWVTASFTEGFNLPAMEAMACRTPVVSTPTGWPEDAIKEGFNGFLVNFADAPALADAIVKSVLQSPASWQLMSQAAFDTVKSNSWQEACRKFELTLEQVDREQTL